MIVNTLVNMLVNTLVKRLWSSALVVLLVVAPAVAQERTLDKAPDTYGWMPTALAIFLIICVIVASFMSAKRGHLD